MLPALSHQRRMQVSLRLRLLFALLSVIFFSLCAYAIYREGEHLWMAYQEEFYRLYRAKAMAALQDGRPEERNKWERLLGELSGVQPEIRQVYLPDAGVADQCMTCHTGVDNPLFTDVPQPYRTHPGDYLKTHPPTRFGCTLCHQGMGVGTTVKAAHGEEENWPEPLLPAAYLEISCLRCHETVQDLPGAETARRGEELFIDKGCYGCHEVAATKELPKFAPPLAKVMAKLANPKKWTYNWLKEPTHIRTDTLMPNFHLKEAEIKKIMAYLLSLPQEPPAEKISLEEVSPQEGKKLFVEQGCRGCHVVKPDEKSLSPRVPNLAGIGAKVTPEWLFRWLEDPKVYNADTPMPKIELKREETLALVAYLMTLQDGKDVLEGVTVDVSGIKPGEGEELVKKYECFGCHEISGFENTRPSVPDLSEFAAKTVEDLDFGTRKDIPRSKWDWLYYKLKEPRAYETDVIKLRMPVMPLSEEELHALTTYTLSVGRSPLPRPYLARVFPAAQALQTGRRLIRHYHCRGCHKIEEEGGEIAQFIERKTFAPPTLKGEGARVQPQWLFQFLKEPSVLRPWMTLRMPTYGFSDAEAQALVDYFTALDKVQAPYIFLPSRDGIPPKRLEWGESIFRVNKCIQCHPASAEKGLPEGVDPEDLSINLDLAKKRLRPQWIGDFLRDPKAIAGSHTRMPLVFYTADGEPKVPDPEGQIEAITDFMMVTENLEEAIKIKPTPEEETDWTKYQY